MSAGEARVVVVTATHRRPDELSRLLGSLQSERGVLAGVVIVDNGDDETTRLMAASAALPTRVITPGRNLGCGGGVARGLIEALRDDAVTHVWLFDDDAEATPGVLSVLLAALDRANADAVVPLVTDAAGAVGWFPGPLSQPAWDEIRRPGVTPALFRARCGDEPLAWTWAPWPSLLVTRRAIAAVGLPRDDFWFQGEDLEWTLRLSARFRCVLAPAAECRHLPPPADAQRVRLKRAAMLQNNLFTATRLPHGRRARRHVPGNAWRFLRAERFAPDALALLVRAHFLGAVRGLPAGAPGGDAVRKQWERLNASKA